MCVTDTLPPPPDNKEGIRVLPDQALRRMRRVAQIDDRTPRAERRLTARQREILTLVAAGLGNRQIAAQIGIGENGVKRHLSSLFAKYQVESRAALVHQARGDLGGDGDDAKLFELLRRTLADVLGQPATDILLRRAAGPEGRFPGEPRSAGEVPVTLHALLDHLWQLLFATTGTVVTRRLERAGFQREPRSAVSEEQV